jgi:hypothetical protein
VQDPNWVQDLVGPEVKGQCSVCGGGPLRSVRLREKFATGSYRNVIQCQSCRSDWPDERAQYPTSASPSAGARSGSPVVVLALGILVVLAGLGAFLALQLGAGEEITSLPADPFPAPPPPAEPEGLPAPVAGDGGIAPGYMPIFDFSVGPGGAFEAFDAPVGACFTRDRLARGGAVTAADAVDCGQPHHYELYAVGDLPATPGFDAVSAGYVFCFEQYEAAISTTLGEDFLYWPVTPSVEAWDAGARAGGCLVEAVGGAATTGSGRPR